MRVLHLITELDVGGAENALATVAAGCKARGLDVEVASLRGPGPIGERLAREGMPVHSIGMRGTWDVGAIGRIAQLLRDRRPDILHTHLFHATLAGRLAAARAGKPHVVSTIQVCERERRWHPLLDGLTQARSDAVICVGEAVRRWAIRQAGMEAWRCHVIPNSVDGPLEARVKRDPERRVLTLGRLHRQKGIDLLIKAIPDVRRRLPEVFFSIAGDGPERDALHRLADRWGVSDRIRWLGWRPDAEALMAGADLFCLPSRWEGLPLSILEAFARGVPVVATTADGNSELLRGGETGWPAPPEDPIGLAGSIVEALTQHEEAARRAGRAREMVRTEYSAERVVERHLALYQHVANRGVPLPDGRGTVAARP